MLNASDIRVFQRVIDILFQRDTASGTYTFVSGDHQPRAGVDNASGDGFRREAPKITECTAPMRAQANIATAASGTIGI
ncbi:Uncharacterised protein [Salmonella enterica subsp. enterica]|nr:Uncharacterised protein [Salmonella enterica subsp. enterica]